jgi:superfamily II DNA or RNA helicase/HKD family nuclease
VVSGIGWEQRCHERAYLLLAAPVRTVEQLRRVNGRAGSPSSREPERATLTAVDVSAGEIGLYEVLLTEALHARLARLDAGRHPQERDLRAAEAADRLALHLGRVLRRVLDDLDERNRVAVGVEVIRSLISRLDELVTGADAASDAPVAPGRVLEAILGERPDGSPESIGRPLIPLLDTTLLTNAPGEPRVGNQLAAEIHSADRIDVVMAFIRRSGIRPLLTHLRRHCEHGRELRVLTTTYTQTTEAAALDLLSELGAQVRVSYDTTTTRLHAKAWLFHRRSGFSTAYLGSSNLTHAAQVTGLEWNVRISAARNPDVIAKMAAVFDSYWESGDFRPYDRHEFVERSGSSDRPGLAVVLPPTELRLEPFQERLLEQIEASRSRGHHRNLLVAATGTGKTVMAAVDYARLRARLDRSRLLVVAHREELLDQSLATFRHALRDPIFGEKWVGGHRPSQFEHVFASIQSLTASGLHALPADHFDVVIVDEFHHAAAPSYRALLDHVRPRELLGLTATPERSDGLPILHYFDDRIAAELRLWDAIDQHRLTPFAYFGIHDGLDLSEVPWRRGRGYDVDGLTSLYTGNDVWARRVIDAVVDRVDDPTAMRALGFCVSVSHARFMARHFNAAGIASVAIWGDSPDEERRRALRDLADGEVNVVFSVDLFNEGVDVPTVDTLLLLRPTDSPTLFLQQLGRGLRRAEGKAVCTVLDFVGHHRREFRFDRRFRALLGGTRRDLERQIEQRFPFLPAGCHLELDPVASEIVLRNIREAIPARWQAKVQELVALADAGHPVRLATYLDHSGLELGDVYAAGRCWSDLRDAAGLPGARPGPAEAPLRRALGRLLHVDDTERLNAYRAFAEGSSMPLEARPERERRLVRMLVAQLADQVLSKHATLDEAVELLRSHPGVLAELAELCDVLADVVDHVHPPLDGFADVPLRIHARYTRLEILAAFGIGTAAKVPSWQTGVYWVGEARADLLAFTLDKTTGGFSPTTRYRDYAISRELIHWESQSVTRADSDTGRRYRHHAELGSSIMLFARHRSDDRSFWFLGPASYVRHEGERPMAITWRLHHPLPGDLFASFAAAVA